MRKPRTFIWCLLFSLVLASCSSGPTGIYTEALEAHTQQIASNQPVLDAKSATILIENRLTLISPEGKLSTSTGWSAGIIVEGGKYFLTAKHCIYPEYYIRDLAKKVSTGWTVSSRDLHVWLPGQRWRSADGSTNRSVGISDDQFTLRYMPKTSFSTYSENIFYAGKTISFEWKEASGDRDDFVVFEVKTPFTVKGLKLRKTLVNEVGKITYAIGYPNGPNFMKSDIVDPEVSTGFIRKIHKMLRTDTLVIGGNSGGPVIDSQGNVIGLVSYRHKHHIAFSVRSDDILAHLP